MKITSRRVAVFLLIVLLSAGFGFAFDAIATAIEKKQYSRPELYREAISLASEEAGIPDAVAFAVIRIVSGFDAGGIDADGGIGLFRITQEQMEMICTDILHEDVPDAGMLYNPATNLRLGCTYLSYLYGRYGMWEPVYASWCIGTETVDEWILNSDYLNKQGKLTKIPDSDVAGFVTRAVKGQKMYGNLYGS